VPGKAPQFRLRADSLTKKQDNPAALKSPRLVARWCAVRELTQVGTVDGQPPSAYGLQLG